MIVFQYISYDLRLYIPMKQSPGQDFGSYQTQVINNQSANFA